MSFVTILNKLNESFDGSSPTDEEKELIYKNYELIRKKLKLNKKQSSGYCAVFCCLLWEAIGNPTSLFPYSVMVGEEEHVVLYNKKNGWIIDPTGDQFGHKKLFDINPKENRGYSKFLKLTSAEIESAKKEVI